MVLLLFLAPLAQPGAIFDLACIWIHSFRRIVYSAVCQCGRPRQFRARGVRPLSGIEVPVPRPAAAPSRSACWQFASRMVSLLSRGRSCRSNRPHLRTLGVQGRLCTYGKFMIAKLASGALHMVGRAAGRFQILHSGFESIKPVVTRTVRGQTWSRVQQGRSKTIAGSSGVHKPMLRSQTRGDNWWSLFRRGC